MKLNLKDIPTGLSNLLVKQAAKTSVRECDEVRKNYFEAYVDEGEETFDVVLEFSPEKDLIRNQCDCSSGTALCRHQVAVLLSFKKKKAVAVKGKKKEIKAIELLETTEPDLLKEWVRQQIQKSKDLEFSFVQYFTAAQKPLTPEEIVSLTESALKVVAGRKRILEASQVKKLVELWEDIHSPILQRFLSNLSNPSEYANFKALVDACLNVESKINSGSQRILKYLEKVVEKTALAIHELLEENSWKSASGYLVDQIIHPWRLRTFYLKGVLGLVHISAPERKEWLLNRLVENYRHATTIQFFDVSEYARMLFNTLDESGFLSRHLRIFKPLTFKNEYNRRLILAYMNEGELEMAEGFCRQQIKNNFKEEYNYPYYHLLKDIYERKGDANNLVKMLQLILPVQPDLDQYLLASSRLSPDKASILRKKVMQQIKGGLEKRERKAGEFFFRLMDHEKNYKEMILHAPDVPYSLVLEYFKPMYETSSFDLLTNLMISPEPELYYFDDVNTWEDDEGEEDALAQLADLLVASYPPDMLRPYMEPPPRGGLLIAMNRVEQAVRERVIVPGGRYKKR